MPPKRRQTYNRKQGVTLAETREILKENGEILDETWENVWGNGGTHARNCYLGDFRATSF